MTFWTRSLAFAVLLALLWPVVYAVWLSFTPSELLEPPVKEWSLRWYEEFFSQPRWTESLRNSLVIAVLAVAFSLFTGGSAALAGARLRTRGRSTTLLDLALLTPLFVPALLIGIAGLPAARAAGIWGTHFSIALFHSLWGMPLVYLALRDALSQMDAELNAAARGLGASPWQSFRLVTLPIASPAVLTGGLMAFIISLNEVVMALFLCTPATDTLPKVILPSLRYTLSPVVSAASSITVLASLAVLLLGAALKYFFKSKT